MLSIGLSILLYAIWSMSFPLGKYALEFCPPIFLTAFRMLLGSAMIYSILFFTDRKSFRISKKQLLSLTILGFFSIYLTNILEYWGLGHLTAGKACFIYSLSPFFTAFFSYLHFNEKMNMRKWIGMSIGFCGIIPVLLTQTGSEGFLKAFGFISWPELAIIGAALFSVYGWVLLRMSVKEDSVSPLMANATSMLIGGAMALGHSFLTESWTPTPVLAGSWWPLTKVMLLSALLSNVIGYNLYGYLLRKLTATFLSFVGLLSPIFASIASWLILGESFSPPIIIATSIIGTGLYLVYKAELSQGYILSKTT
ncbi:MAG: DMT family transporter [Candidatus Algichlamydia australiensis]|nr:DMT family transporter [Chlamydiales bacterium]